MCLYEIKSLRKMTELLEMLFGCQLSMYRVTKAHHDTNKPKLQGPQKPDTRQSRAQNLASPTNRTLLDSYFSNRSIVLRTNLFSCMRNLDLRLQHRLNNQMLLAQVYRYLGSH